MKKDDEAKKIVIWLEDKEDTIDHWKDMAYNENYEVLIFPTPTHISLYLEEDQKEIRNCKRNKQLRFIFDIMLVGIEKIKDPKKGGYLNTEEWRAGIDFLRLYNENEYCSLFDVPGIIMTERDIENTFIKEVEQISPNMKVINKYSSTDEEELLFKNFLNG